MTYLFTNPQVKKWKTLFWLSFCMNIIFIGLIIYTSNESGKEGLSAETAAAVQTPENTVQDGNQAAAQENDEG